MFDYCLAFYSVARTACRKIRDELAKYDRVKDRELRHYLWIEEIKRDPWISHMRDIFGRDKVDPLIRDSIMKNNLPPQRPALQHQQNSPVSPPPRLLYGPAGN